VARICYWKISLILTLLAFGLLPARSTRAGTAFLWPGHNLATTSGWLQSSPCTLNPALGQTSEADPPGGCNFGLHPDNLQVDNPDPIYYLYLPLVTR
jgi:hypothetical protein